MNKPNECFSAMSQTDQQTTLKNFREKEIQGIVATSVAEEGIDVPDCDLVILYNYIGNEVSYKQAMGRLLMSYRTVTVSWIFTSIWIEIFSLLKECKNKQYV